MSQAAALPRTALAAVLLIAATLQLVGLGDGYLWQDEAQTALLGRSVLEHGLPLGFDAQNHFSQELGAEYGEDGIWRWHTWLPFYVLAAFFAVFGESTAVARLPFALAGLGTVAATYALALTLWSNRRAALAAALVLALSVPFLLLSRQCRWYSFAALFTVLALRGYLDLMAGRRRGGALFAAGTILLFHTHYLYAGAVGTACFGHLLLWHRERWRPFAAWTVACVPFCAPWIVWLATGMEYARVYGDTAFDLTESWQRASLYAAKLLEHAVSPVLWIAVAAVAWLERRRGGPLRSAGLWRPVSLLLLVLLTHGVALSLVSPGAFFRYLTPLLPILAIAAGAIAVSTAKLHRLAPALVLAVIVVRPPLIEFFGELIDDFRGPIESIVAHLEANGKPGDLVAISYGDLPLKFYTPMRVLGGMTGEDLSPAVAADWVILRRNVVERDRDGRVRDTLLSMIDLTKYRPIELPAVDTRFENREAPDLHRFRSAAEGDPVVVLQRIGGGS